MIICPTTIKRAVLPFYDYSNLRDVERGGTLFENCGYITFYSDWYALKSVMGMERKQPLAKRDSE